MKKSKENTKLKWLLEQQTINRTLPKHPNVVDFIGCCFTPGLAIVLERKGENWISLREVLDHFASKANQAGDMGQPPTFSQKLSISISIAQAMNHLHKNAVLNLSLYTQNILVMPIHSKKKKVWSNIANPNRIKYKGRSPKFR